MNSFVRKYEDVMFKTCILQVLLVIIWFRVSTAFLRSTWPAQYQVMDTLKYNLVYLLIKFITLAVRNKIGAIKK